MTGAFPRDDGADDPQRLASRVGKHMLAKRDGLALELGSEAAEIAEDVRRELGLAARLGAQRIAGLERDGAGHLLDARLHRLGNLEQRPAALARRHLAPGRKSPARGGDGGFDIGRRGARHFGHGRALGRIFDADPRTRRTADPFAVDQHAFGLIGAGRSG